MKNPLDYDFNNMSVNLGSGNTTTGIYTTASSNTNSIYNASYDYTLTNPSYNWITTGTGTDTITISDWTTANHSLEVKGDANFEGDIKIKGKSLLESLEKIEEKLAILKPNEKLEEKWDQLRELRKQYMELEKEIIEKEKVWDILKK